jgi:two-component system phosphate regulon sensor histidine kinase PhoR
MPEKAISEAISLEQARPVFNALPFPVFISTFADVTSPVFVNDALLPFATSEEENTPVTEDVSLEKLFTLDNSGGKKQRQWASLLQENLPLAVTCRSLKNERYKISLEALTLDGKPYVLGVISLFQEDVALTQAHHDFVSIMSHEFRTPLTSIRGFADTMLHYGTKLAPEQQTRFIKIIRDQSDRLSRMVENILIISKLGQEQKKPQARPVLLSDLVSKVNGALQGKGVNVEKRFVFKDIDCTESLWAEPDSLEQVLLNLMDNAVKYSPEAKTITVSAEPFNEDPRRFVKIMVADQGDGINEEQLTKLFSKFYRTANHMTQQVEGSGLGLYITKTIVQRMGGQIGVESEVGKGSRFWFTVPFNTLEMQSQYRKSILLSGEGSYEEDDF